MSALVTLLCAPVEAGPRDHDNGFFLRLSAGIGGAYSELAQVGDTAVQQLKASGFSGDGHFAIGAIVTPDLAVHLTIWGWTVVQPDIEINEQPGALNVDFLSTSAIGLGATYYFMPVNIYVSGSVGGGYLVFDGRLGDFPVQEESNLGWVVDFTMGKEWWAGRRWGLGVGFAFSYHTVPDADVKEHWRGIGLAIRFSATYN